MAADEIAEREKRPHFAGLLQIEWLAGGQMMGGKALVLLPSVGVVMCAVGLLAAVGPARRGLAVQPTEALREE